MKMIRAAIAAVVALGVLAVASHAQDGYPNRPVRMIIPYPAGGSTDGLARIILPRVGEQIGQQVVIDNRGGAGGIIGTSLAVRAAPDGYTLLMVFDVHAVNPYVFKKLPYDTFNLDSSVANPFRR